MPLALVGRHLVHSSAPRLLVAQVGPSPHWGLVPQARDIQASEKLREAKDAVDAARARSDQTGGQTEPEGEGRGPSKTRSW